MDQFRFDRGGRIDLSVQKKGRERDVIVVVVVCERGDTQVHLIQMLTMGMGVGSR